MMWRAEFKFTQRHMTEILTRAEYLRLAAQFDDRAKHSNPTEAAEYRSRAAVFRQLADARLPFSGKETHFVRRTAKRGAKPTAQKTAH